MTLSIRRFASSLYPRKKNTSSGVMNRPRNRQPRPPNQVRHNQNQNSGLPRQAPSSFRGAPGTPQQLAGTVPRSSQVVPGAQVYVVLKQDQPTGRETGGVVQDLLSRGDHPRGIKVRLRGGLVGRVQRMGAPASEGPDAQGGLQQQQQRFANGGSRERVPGGAVSSSGRFSMRYTDVRNEDEFPSMPPARSLADFIKTPPSAGADEGTNEAEEQPNFEQATVKCPFCESFEGDEAAVRYHIDKIHLT